MTLRRAAGPVTGRQFLMLDFARLGNEPMKWNLALIAGVRHGGNFGKILRSFFNGNITRNAKQNWQCGMPAQ